MHFFSKNVRENHPASYKVKGQLSVIGLLSSSAAMSFRLNCKHLCKYEQRDDEFQTNNSNSLLR